MTDINLILRNIPQIEILLNKEEISFFIPKIGRNIVTKIIRDEIDQFRKNISNNKNHSIEDLISSIITKCTIKNLKKLQRVINGTGVIIHTNLGRSPISEKIFEKLKDSISGYCNLEYELHGQKRGKRGGFVEELIADLTSAEDALIVNNNASSVFLILNTFAKGKEAIVSRGELIQIGGGFRIPDIMEESGAKLVEVGTTNITSIDDFNNAITEETSMIFSAHQSNYKIEGFTESPSLKDLSTLKSDSILFIRDLGSGNLNNDKNLPQPFEPVIPYEMSQGPDLLCFSGDKLLGGSQAGIIIGKKELIAKLRKHPLMRMIRVDKITYFILQETLLEYANNQLDNISLWEIINSSKNNSNARIDNFLKLIDNPNKKYIKKISSMSTFGGGCLPTLETESDSIEIKIPVMTSDKLYTYFINSKIPIIGTIVNDSYRLDFKTIFDADIQFIAESINQISKNKGK
jgi:L-seryl-tRNA(Ser) seleniumtransferase